MTRPVRVLLVEDNAADVFLASLHLRALPRPVVLRTAGTAAAACEALAAGAADVADRPDLVLLDLNLPGEGGAAVLAMARATPALQDVAIVVLSTSASAEDAARCHALGATDYRVKPDTAGAHAALLAELVARWAPPNDRRASG